MMIIRCLPHWRCLEIITRLSLSLIIQQHLLINTDCFSQSSTTSSFYSLLYFISQQNRRSPKTDQNPPTPSLSLCHFGPECWSSMRVCTHHLPERVWLISRQRLRCDNRPQADSGGLAVRDPTRALKRLINLTLITLNVYIQRGWRMMPGLHNILDIYTVHV